MKSQNTVQYSGMEPQSGRVFQYAKRIALSAPGRFLLAVAVLIGLVSIPLLTRANDRSGQDRNGHGRNEKRTLTGNWLVTVTRVNPGRGPEYADYLKQTNAAREKAGLDEHSTVWSVTSGAQAGTFLVFTFNRSLGESDALRTGMDARTQKLNEALGGEAIVKQRQKLYSEVVAQSTTTLYAFNRGISRPSPEFVAADPAFWKSSQKQLAQLEPAKK